MRPILPLLLTVTACEHGLDAPPDAGAPDLATPCTAQLSDPVTKVDVLFMVDDSAGLSDLRLRTHIPDLLKALDDVAIAGQKLSYHFGVVTSDLGAPGISCGSNRGAKLQQVGAGAGAGCLGAVGKPYLEYDQASSTSNSPAGQDLATTLGCMMSVGDKGCGFEMPLEAVYRALHDPIPENQGFLRSDAALAVFFITDEDDCSADPTSDLFTPGTTYGPQNSFRCSRYGIVCDGALLSGVATPAYASCRPATAADGGKLTEVQKYISFFTQPASRGGVKVDPRRVVVYAVSAPSSPFGTGTSTGAQICGPGMPSCTTLAHSCISPNDAQLFADPAVRLNAVVDAVPAGRVTDYCNGSVDVALEGFAAQIADATAPKPLCAL